MLPDLALTGLMLAHMRAPVAVAPARHGARRWRGLTDFGFAQGLRLVPLTLAEVEVAASALPVAFVRVAGQHHWPVAILRVRAATSPFVGPAKQWQAAYIPALLRAYPFVAQAQPTSGQAANEGARMALLVDEGSGLVTDTSTDQRFFDPLGAPSAALDQVVGFFRHFHANLVETSRAMALLDDDPALFVPARLKDGTVLDGISAIDPAHFAGLSDAALGALHANGALTLIMANLVGRHQLDFLDRAEAALSRGNPAQAGGPDLPDAAPDVSDFLSALAYAQERDSVTTLAPAGGPDER